MTFGVAALPTHSPISNGHVAVALRRLLALELERADQAGGARELVEREQPQRVAHDDAHAGAGAPGRLGMAQAAQHHREGREPEVGLGLAAAGREEEEVDGLAVGVARVGDPREVQRG